MSHNQFKRKQVVRMFGPWLRLYVDVYDNPKVQSLPPSLFRSWVNVLCVAKKFGGKSGRIPLENLAFYLRCATHEVDPIIGELIRAGLLEYAEDSGDRILRPKDWIERQMVDSSLSTERVKRHRQKLKKSGDEPRNVSCNVSGNANGTMKRNSNSNSNSSRYRVSPIHGEGFTLSKGGTPVDAAVTRREGQSGEISLTDWTGPDAGDCAP